MEAEMQRAYLETIRRSCRNALRNAADVLPELVRLAAGEDVGKLVHAMLSALVASAKAASYHPWP